MSSSPGPPPMAPPAVECSSLSSPSPSCTSTPSYSPRQKRPPVLMGRQRPVSGAPLSSITIPRGTRRTVITLTSPGAAVTTIPRVSVSPELPSQPQKWSSISITAARARADVVLLTDHDTLEAKDRGEEGWYGDVLLLAGEEVSPLGRDHYLAFGLEEHVRHRGLDACAIARAVRDAGGFGFAAHPFSEGSVRFKRPGMPFAGLDCDALDGIELWNFANDTGERVSSIAELVRLLATPARLLDHPPERNTRRWDELCRTRRVVAIGGLDAHQYGKRIGPIVPVRVMAYHRTFRLIRTHVLCEEPPQRELERDRELVYGALRAGRCYIAVDSVAPARGFRFEAADVPMGGEAAAG